MAERQKKRYRTWRWEAYLRKDGDFGYKIFLRRYNEGRVIYRRTAQPFYKLSTTNKK